MLMSSCCADVVVVVLIDDIDDDDDDDDDHKCERGKGKEIIKEKREEGRKGEMTNGARGGKRCGGEVLIQIQKRQIDGQTEVIK